jgi:hypothetical protein
VYDKSDSYLDILFNIDSNNRLTTTLYDKRDDVDFAIVNSRFLCSNVPLSLPYVVYIPLVEIRYTGLPVVKASMEMTVLQIV